MEECNEQLVRKENRNQNECRHAAALIDIKNTVRKLSHDLSQPIMLLQGYLELLELQKITLDGDGIERFLNRMKSQLDVFHDLNEKLRVIAVPVHKK